MFHLKLISCYARTNFQLCPYIARRWNSKIYQEIAREKRRPVTKALSQFDDFYGSLFLNQWPSIRVALLSPEKKAVVINNFSDKERVVKDIQSQGAFNVQEVCKTRYNFLINESRDSPSVDSAFIYQLEGRIEDTLLRQQEADLDKIYPEPLDQVTTDEVTRNLANKNTRKNVREELLDERKRVMEDPTKDTPLAESLKSADYDITRLIIPGPTSISVTASLYDYMPATKLKGMDDYIPESAHYRYYTDSTETPVTFEVQHNVEFPELLEVYAFERGNCDTFEYSKKGTTDVFDYHIINLGYLAPILALGIERGDFVLDLTSASLDITMLIAQTLAPGMFVVNCGTSSRGRYILRHLDSYLFDVGGDRSNILVTNYHPLEVQESEKFDKIIVCAPSTCDRSAVTSDEGNLFNPARVKERIKLPEVQSAYLKKALQLVKEGGVVVYYTESLSPIQNDAVVQRVLDDLWLNSNMKFVIKDLSKGMEPLQSFMKIEKTGKFGHLVVPFLPNNCGPLFFTKILKCTNEESLQ